MDWKNRIVGYGTKPADQFKANPLNARTHPEAQRRAVKGSLDTLGWIAPVIENVRTGNLIDGHDRIWQALQNDGEEVPYIQVDLSENEEKLALASFDFITTMAEYDKQLLDELLREVNTTDAAMMETLAKLAEEAGLLLSLGDGDGGEVDDREITFAVTINCDDEGHQRELLERFEEEGLTCRALML